MDRVAVLAHLTFWLFAIAIAIAIVIVSWGPYHLNEFAINNVLNGQHDCRCDMVLDLAET